LGSASAKAKFYSTQGFDDASQDAVSELNTQTPEIDQGHQSDAAPEFFSFDSPAAVPMSEEKPAAQPQESYSSGRTYQPRGVYKVMESAGPDVSFMKLNHSWL